MQDVLYNIGILNGLFTEKDFNFLKNSNSYETVINTRLQKATSEREKIVEYTTNLSSNPNKNANFQNSDAHGSADLAFKKINKIIVSLYKLKEQLEDIEKEILELIVKKESSIISNSELDNAVFSIKSKINEFDLFSKETDKVIYGDYVVVNYFFETYYESDTTLDSTFNNDYNNKDTFSVVDADEIVDNPILKISEKSKKVFLPYSKSEILEYVKTYPNIYKSCRDVIEREYIVDLNFYTRHPALSRFREVYSLIHDREMKSVIDAFKRAIDLMFKYELNPAIVAGLKSENQLDLLLDCIEKNKMDNFTPFEIVFEVNLM